MSTTRGTCITAFALVLIWAVLRGAPAAGSALPQEHEYQKTLRGYMAGLTEEDFAIELRPVTMEESAFPDTDTWARYWMLTVEGTREFARDCGLRVSPRHFTLQAIEVGEGVQIQPGFVEPLHLAWWTQWDYPGNPYHGSKAAQRRALVWSMADMMVLDHAHDNGEYCRSDYLGGGMIRFAYPYYVGKDVLPESARLAYAAGLVRLFEKLERWTPQGSGGSDMEMFQLVGMWYAAQALGGDFPQRALARAHVVLNRVTSKTGYELHGGAFDVSYQGIALRFLTWAALLYEDPGIDEALHKMIVLKSHLTLPEPGGVTARYMNGPTHFSSGTAMDAPNDQWAWPSRDIAMAMIDDGAMYLLRARTGIPAPDELAKSVRKLIGAVGPTEPLDKEPGTWAEDHWERTINFAFDRYRPGFYARLLALDKADDPILHPLFARAQPFIRDLNNGGEFLAAKIGDYGAIIHTGAIALQWADGVSGKSGGSLSAFWTPGRGTAILGRTRATQGNPSDEWTDETGCGPYTWAVHTITGRGAGGQYFSASRIRDIASEYRINADRGAAVTVSGDLGGSTTADPGNQLSGAADYSRRFVLDQEGLTIDSKTVFEKPGEVAELWEMVPVFLGSRKAEAELAFRVNGQWQPADETLVPADRVRLTRYGTHVDIVFEAPRSVRLSPGNATQNFSRAVMRNVMIDLLSADGKCGITYRIVAVP